MFLNIRERCCFVAILFLLQHAVQGLPAAKNNTTGAAVLCGNHSNTKNIPWPSRQNGSISSLLSQLPPSVLGMLSQFPAQNGIMQRILTGNMDLSSLLETTKQFLPSARTIIEAGLKDKSISSACETDIMTLITATTNGEFWALRMLDAWGKIPRGILQGNLDFMGQYDECRETVSGIVQSNSTTNHVIRGTTCIAYIKPPSSLIPAALPELLGGTSPDISWHLCLPDSCRKDDVIGLTKQVLADVNFTTTRAFCRDQEQPDFSKDTGAIVSLVIVCLLLACVVLGSLVDLYNRFSPLKRKDTYTLPKISGGTTDETAAAGGFHNGSISKVKVESDEKLTSKPESGDIALQNRNVPNGAERIQNKDDLWQKLFLSFSAFRNSEKILSTRAARDSIGALHGIRVISMSWVILGHTFLVLYPVTENPVIMADYFKSYHFQVIINAGVSVDTFFILSGVLTAYLFLKETSKTSRVTCKQMALYYFHRFWRLSPTLMVWMMIYTTLFRYVGDGPEWNGPYDQAQCLDKGWVYNLLYISNFIEQKYRCFDISWFLSNDMQFYILAPLALVPLTYGFRAIGFTVIASFIVTHIASTIALVLKYDANLLHNNAEYYNLIYIRPYTRIGTYAIGLALGYALQKTNRTFPISRKMQVLGWMCSVAVALTTLYARYGEMTSPGDWNAGQRAAFETGSRIGWALSVCWVILVCATGSGGLVNSVLSWEGWLPLSRLTFGAYLIHILVMVYDVNTHRVRGYITLYYIISKFFGFCTATYLFAFVNALVVEAPLLGIEKILLKKR